MNAAPRIIVRLWSTFSGPLFVTAPIHPAIVDRLRDTFLFWIRTIKMRQNAIITSRMINRDIFLYYFLKNKSE